MTVYSSPLDFKETRKFKSKWDEYKNGDWKKHRSNVYVTLETVIPEKPAKPLGPPDEDAYKKKLKDIEDKIKDITKNIDDKRSQFDEILSAKIASNKSGDGTGVHSKEIGLKLKRLGELNKQKQKIFDK